MQVGHTHEDIDQVFSRFSNALRGRNVWTPTAMQEAFRQCWTSHREIVKDSILGGEANLYYTEACEVLGVPDFDSFVRVRGIHYAI